MTDEFSNIVTGNGSHVVVLAGKEGNQNLEEVEISISALQHSSILFEKGFRVGGSPLETTRLHFVLVHFPARHVLVVFEEQLVHDADICGKTG
jgi:hypothetical protein